jgi:DNA replication licensing factor MCM2
VELTDPILSRFDCLVVLQDTVDPVADELLAKFVVGSHMRSIPTDEQVDIGRGEGEATRMQLEEEHNTNNPLMNDQDEVTIPQSLLRKYIQYARTAVHPQLKGFDQDKVAQLYVRARRGSGG